MNGWSDGEQTAGEQSADEQSADEHVLQQLRDWLAQTRAEAERAVAESGAECAGAGVEPDEDDKDDEDDEDGAAAGLMDVVAAFTALRHEVKLETRSARGLREQSESLLAALQESLRRFDSVQADEAKAARQAAGPLAESLAELDETMERGLAALEQARRQGRQALGQAPPELQRTLDEQYRRLPWWRRWAAGRFYQGIQQGWTEQAARSQRALWDSLADGYRLMHARLQRSMESHGIRRIPTVGRPVDPHAMTVVEIVDAAGRQPGTVAEELRPGYRWNGKVLRFAEVRAVRAADATPAGDE